MKQVFYGVALLAIVVLKRRGLWPWLRARLGLERGAAVSALSRFRASQAVETLSWLPGGRSGVLRPYRSPASSP